MFKYTLKRIGLALVTAFIILSLTFILMRLIPFSKPSGFEGQLYAYYEEQVRLGFVVKFTSEQTNLGEYLWAHANGLNVTEFYYVRPVMEQYGAWMKNIFTEWNWGTSTYIKPGIPAMMIIGEKLAVSIQVNIVSVIISVPLGIGLGILAALKKNTWIDHTISTLVMVFISIPSFVIISFLMLWLCYGAKVLPSQWDFSANSFVIPVMALSFGSICGYCRFTRAELCEVMSSEYLLLARTKGLTRRQAILRHALRNAMVPIVPSILAEFIGILGGSMILETLYGIPGIGRLYIDALGKKDYNLVMVDMAVFTLIGLMAGVLLDLSYGFIDPRIRMGAKK